MVPITWRRHRQLDPDLAALLGPRPRLLASGRCGAGQVVATLDRLWFPDSGAWQQLRWQDVQRGGWDAAGSRLYWTTVDGSDGAIPLEEPGRLPDVFNERVSASIVLSRVVPLGSGGSAVISARKDLGEPDPVLTWRTSPGPGTSTDAVAADPAVAGELARLRAEYDLG